MPDVDHEVLTLQEAADRFRVSVATIRRWTKEGSIAIVPLPGRTIRIRRADIEAFLTPAHVDDEVVA